MYKVVIIDDDKEAIHVIETYLAAHFSHYEVAGKTTMPVEGIKLIDGLQPNVVFLDIMMPEMTGFDLLDQITYTDFNLLFATSFNSFATQAFRANAIDYLLKPVNLDRFVEAMNKIEKTGAKDPLSRNNFNVVKKLLSNKLEIPGNEGKEFINIKDIISIKADGCYSEINLRNGKKKLVSKTIKACDEKLCQKGFFRTHRSHIVNLDYISRFKSYATYGEIEMIDGSKIKLARRKKDEFIDLLSEHVN